MASNDTSYGIQNYTVVPLQYSTGSETALLAPSASGVQPSFPSPVFPLSTTANPCVVYIAPSPDIAGSVFDGHPFEIKFAAKFTSAANFSLTVNIWQATNAIVSPGPSASGYSVLTTTPPAGTGVTKLVTGTATAANTTSGTIIYSGQYVWDSVSKVLGIAGAGTTYQKGVSITTTQSAATVASLNFNDLNFFPTLNFTTNLPTSFVITEFTIKRI